MARQARNLTQGGPAQLGKNERGGRAARPAPPHEFGSHWSLRRGRGPVSELIVSDCRPGRQPPDRPATQLPPGGGRGALDKPRPKKKEGI